MEDTKRMISGVIFILVLVAGGFWYFSGPDDINPDIDYYKTIIQKLEQTNKELSAEVKEKEQKIEQLLEKIKKLEDRWWWRPDGSSGVGSTVESSQKWWNSDLTNWEVLDILQKRFSEIQEFFSKNEKKILSKLESIGIKFESLSVRDIVEIWLNKDKL